MGPDAAPVATNVDVAAAQADGAYAHAELCAVRRGRASPPLAQPSSGADPVVVRGLGFAIVVVALLLSSRATARCLCVTTPGLKALTPLEPQGPLVIQLPDPELRRALRRTHPFLRMVGRPSAESVPLLVLTATLADQVAFMPAASLSAGQRYLLAFARDEGGQRMEGVPSIGESTAIEALEARELEVGEGKRGIAWSGSPAQLRGRRFKNGCCPEEAEVDLSLPLGVGSRGLLKLSVWSHGRWWAWYQQRPAKAERLRLYFGGPCKGSLELDASGRARARLSVINGVGEDMPAPAEVPIQLGPH